MPFKSKDQMKWMFANHPEMAKRWAKHTKNIKSLPESVGKEEKKALALDVLSVILKNAAYTGFGAKAPPAALKPKPPTLTSIPNKSTVPQQPSNQQQYGANGQEAVKQKAKQLQPVQNTKVSFLKKLAEEPVKDLGAMPSRTSLMAKSAPKAAEPPKPSPAYADPIFRSLDPHRARQLEYQDLTAKAPPTPKPSQPTMQAAPAPQQPAAKPTEYTGTGFKGLFSSAYPSGFSLRSLNPFEDQATTNQNIHPPIEFKTKPEAYSGWAKALTESGGRQLPTTVSNRLDLSKYAPSPTDTPEVLANKEQRRYSDSLLLKNLYNMRNLYSKDDASFLSNPRAPITTENLLDLSDKEQRIFTDYFKQKYPNQEVPNFFSLINSEKTPEQQKILSDYMSESMQPRMAKLYDSSQADIGRMGDESNLRTAQGISELALKKLTNVDADTLKGGNPLSIGLSLAGSPLLAALPIGKGIQALERMAPAAGFVKRLPTNLAKGGLGLLSGINEAETLGSGVEGAAQAYDPNNRELQETARNLGNIVAYNGPAAFNLGKGLVNVAKNINDPYGLLRNSLTYLRKNPGSSSLTAGEEALNAGLAYRDYTQLPTYEKFTQEQLGTPEQRKAYRFEHSEDEAQKAEGNPRLNLINNLLAKYQDQEKMRAGLQEQTNSRLPFVTSTTQKLRPSDFKSQISSELPAYTGAGLDFGISEYADTQLSENNIDERINNLASTAANQPNIDAPTAQSRLQEEADINKVLQNSFGSNIDEYSGYKKAVKSVGDVRKEYEDVMRRLEDSSYKENQNNLHITDPALAEEAKVVTAKYQNAMKQAAPVMVPFLTKSLDKRFEKEIAPIQENAPQLLSKVNSVRDKIKQNQPITEEDMKYLEDARDAAYRVKSYTVERMKLQFLRGQDLDAQEMHHLFGPGKEVQERALDQLSGAAAEDISHYKKVVDPSTGRVSYTYGFDKASDTKKIPFVMPTRNPVTNSNQPAAAPTPAPQTLNPTPPPSAPAPAPQPAQPAAAPTVQPVVTPPAPAAPQPPAVAAPAKPQGSKPSLWSKGLSLAKEKYNENKPAIDAKVSEISNSVFDKLKEKANTPTPTGNPVAQEAGLQLENRIKEQAPPEVQQNPGMLQNIKSVFWDNLNPTEKTLLVSGMSLAAIAAIGSMSGDDDEEGGSNILPLLGLIGAGVGLSSPVSKYLGVSNPLGFLTGGGIQTQQQTAGGAPSSTSTVASKENILKLMSEGKKPEAAKMLVGMIPWYGVRIFRNALVDPNTTPDSLAKLSDGKLDVDSAAQVLANKEYILPLLK